MAAPVFSSVLRRRLSLVDIGARGGIDPRWAPLQDHIEVVGFDADADECERLNATGSRIRFLPYGIGARDGECGLLRICRAPGCSSFLEPNHAFVAPYAFGQHMEVVRTVPVTLTTLDTACAREGLRPDYLKLDVQGAELAVLTGASATLERVLVVETEVEFQPLYVGQPLFGDVDAALRARGFMLLGLRRTLWRRHHPVLDSAPANGGTLMHGDALYVRPLDQITDAGQAVALAMLLSAYGQVDTIIAILHGPHAALQALPAAEREAMYRRLVARPTWGHRVVSRVLGRWHHRQLRQWVDGYRPTGATDWHDPEFH